MGLLGGVDAGFDRCNHIRKLGRRSNGRTRIQAAPAMFFHFIGFQAEDKDVFVADLFANFNIGAVKGPDGQSAVQR